MLNHLLDEGCVDNQKLGEDFSGGPVVKTLCPQCRGHGFDPWLEKIVHAAWRKKQKQK